VGTFWCDFKFWKQSKTSKNAENSKSNESAAILVQLLEVSSISRCGFVFSKSREVAKSPHTVWPPLFNGRAEVPQNGKLVGCVLAVLLCVLCLLVPAVESSPSPALALCLMVLAVCRCGGCWVLSVLTQAAAKRKNTEEIEQATIFPPRTSITRRAATTNRRKPRKIEAPRYSYRTVEM